VNYFGLKSKLDTRDSAKLAICLQTGVTLWGFPLVLKVIEFVHSYLLHSKCHCAVISRCMLISCWTL